MDAAGFGARSITSSSHQPGRDGAGVTMSSTLALSDVGAMRDKPSAPGIRRRRKQARRNELLDAALALFVEKGFADTRTEEIAARAGVSKGTIYLYFSSKEEMLKAVIARQVSSRISMGAQQAAKHNGSCADLLRRLLEAWWLLLADAAVGGVFKLVITEVRKFPQLMDFWVREVEEPGRRLIGRVVREGMDRGEFRRLDPDVVVRSLVLPMIMGCLHRHTIGACAAVDPLLDDPDFFARHVEFVLDGLVPRACAPAFPSAPVVQ